jgi:cobalt-precorrin 5A hydrolase/precorrin-3B C17-methyltransferase
MNTENKLIVFYITDKGRELAQKITAFYPEAGALKFERSAVLQAWKECRSLVFIMAAGIVVRTIAPLLRDKKTDPAIVVIDEKGRHGISLLSGHLGGSNTLAKEISEVVGSEAVITTASDINDLPSIDLWAKERGLVIGNWDLLPQTGTRLINEGIVHVYSDIDMALPDAFIKTDKPELADIVITNREKIKTGGGEISERLYLRPVNLVIGIGCNRGTPAEEIEDFIKKTLADNNLAFASVHSIATIDKKGDEKGLIAFAKKYSLGISTFTAEELNQVKGITVSEAALRATGARAVAEPAALLASQADSLLLQKQKSGNVTVAVADLKDRNALCVMSDELKNEKPKPRQGKIYIVGTGPGDLEHITPYARKAIQKSDVIVGYGTYLDLIKELTGGKEIVSTGMTQEIDRCRKALELASSGRTVSVISGGDPGIYAMAGLVFELLRKEHQTAGMPSIEVIPGISALNACASRLGAPLMHDFASISLSDRLTPWELIEKRLAAAAMADFVIALYNPKSKGRVDHIDKARAIIMKHRRPDTPVGLVTGAMRGNERIVVTDLEHIPEHDIGMQTTVIIGNSNTFAWDGWMVTPRGYEKKRQYSNAGSK